MTYPQRSPSNDRYYGRRSGEGDRWPQHQQQQQQQQYEPFYFQPQTYGFSQSQNQPLLTQGWPAANNALQPQDTGSHQHLNAHAPSFVPYEQQRPVKFAAVNKRCRINKHSRYGQISSSRGTYSGHYLESGYDVPLPPPPPDDVPPPPPDDGLNAYPEYWSENVSYGMPPPPPPPDDVPPPPPDDGLNAYPEYRYENVSVRPPPSKPPGQKKKSRKKAKGPAQQLPSPQRPPLSPSALDTDLRKSLRQLSVSPGKPKKVVLPRPQPAELYLTRANRESIREDAARPLLVILDLNGTLLHRKHKGGSSFVKRPNVEEFLHYLLTNHRVMVWSSAKPKNVEAMCDQLLPAHQKKELVAIWGRDMLRLPDTAYNEKVQVYKQLKWVWTDQQVQATQPNINDWWSQENTVLIDDSKEKAASEPHNILEIEEFEGRQDQIESDVLGQVVEYLDELKFHRDVSASMRKQPFVYDSQMEYDWMPIINDMH